MHLRNVLNMFLLICSNITTTYFYNFNSSHNISLLNSRDLVSNLYHLCYFFWSIHMKFNSKYNEQRLQIKTNIHEKNKVSSITWFFSELTARSFGHNSFATQLLVCIYDFLYCAIQIGGKWISQSLRESPV